MKANFRFTSHIALAFILGLAIACARKPDDAKVTADIQNRFSQDSGLASKQLTVQADGGTVTLTGTVDNEAQREAAGKQAASVSGVKTVINNLVVGNAPMVASNTAPEEVPAASPAAETVPVSAPPPQEKAKPAAGKKSHKSKSSNTNDSASVPSSDSNTDSSNSNQTMASNQPPAEVQPQAPPPPVDNTPPPPPPPKKFIIDQGTQLTVRLIDPIDSEKNQTGDTFHATLNTPLTSDGEEAVPAGIELTGHLVSVKSAGKFAGQSEVVLQLDSLSSGGRTYNLQTDTYRKDGSSRGKNTAEKVGGGAVIGTIIGALAGGGKGAAIGAAAGAGVGGGVQAATKAQQIKLASETVLNFTLQAQLTVVQAQSPDANRKKLTNSQ